MRRLSSLRYRLLSLVLIPLLLLSGSVLFLAYRWSSDFAYEQLFAKVNTDLRVVHDKFADIKTDTQHQLSALANSAQLSEALALGDTTRLNEWVSLESKLGDFDFLNLLSPDGSQIISTQGWKPHILRRSALTDHTLTTRNPSVVSGIEIYSAEQWQRQNGLEASVVVLPLLETPRAAPTNRQWEDRAMVIRTLQTLHDAVGNRVALLEAGILLNRNFNFVDQIRDLVYGPGSLPPKGLGTVTVFLDDVRITTNVMLSDNSRALGTRVSNVVREAVLNRGETWVDRAFVVNDWYISAYEPIINTAGQRVGMLYAGYLEAPYRRELFKALKVLSALVLAGSLVAALAAIYGARSIFAPIETITAVVRATARGERKRIGPIPAKNEIGELAGQFDVMLDTLDTHNQRIELDALALEEKVRQRTSELEKQNTRLQESIELLQHTRQKLANAEKLAALGELTAGVAHEINNPTAVILGNMDVLVADLGDQKDEFHTEIELIIKQVYRIRSITDRLLQYSRSVHENGSVDSADVLRESDASTVRQSDASPSIDQLLMNQQDQPVCGVDFYDVLQDTLQLFLHELEGLKIHVVVECDSIPCVLIDRDEFQQVLVNLISNAIQAIGEHGQITVSTRHHSDNTICVEVHDTGCGIAAEHVDRVFDPFFTAGKAQGTGLGLSVSYGIVRRYGGDIVASSVQGKGSTLSLTLPAAASNGKLQTCQ